MTETTPQVPAGSCLLTYDLLTLPDPLVTGREATLDIVVTNTTTQVVHCQQITVVLSVGTNAHDLVHTVEGVFDLDVEPLLPEGLTGRRDLRDWTAVFVQDGVVVVLPQQESCPFAPTSSRTSAHTDIHGLIIRIPKVAINDEPGTGRIEVLETAIGTVDRPWPDSPASCLLDAAKHLPSLPPPELPPMPFWAENVGRQATGCVRRPSGSAPNVRLRWSGPVGMTYLVDADESREHQEKTPRRSEEMWAEFHIDRDTTFRLSARPEAGTRVPLAATTVTVSDPRLPGVDIDTDLGGAPHCLADSVETDRLGVDGRIVVNTRWGTNGPIALPVDGYGRLGR